MKLAPRRNFQSDPRIWGVAFLFAVLAWASFYNLANYPVLWWDEAIFSETAANLAQHGRYAFTVQSPDQLSDFDYRISAGPAVILPVALVYRLFGVGLVQGRVAAGLYLLFTFGALFWAGRRLFGFAPAFLAVVLALVGTDIIYWGRSVLGDVPALGWFLLALGFLDRGLEEENRPDSLFWGGLFLGVAFCAKEFYGFAFLPPLWLLARQAWRSGSLPLVRTGAYLGGLSVPLLAYLALKALVLGGLGAALWHFWEQKALLRHEFFTPLTIGRVYLESFRYLLTHPLFLAGAAGALWVWQRGALTDGRRLWLGNFLLWTLVYCTSVYWHRFALPALLLAAPLAAWLVFRILGHLTREVPRPALVFVQAGLLAWFFSWLAPVVGLDYLRLLCHQKQQPPCRVVEYLEQHLPPQCLIETPEYELVFLDDRNRYHLMPAFFFVEATEKEIKLLNPRQVPYNFNHVEADVLILGGFGKGVFSQVYPPALVHRHWEKVAQVENYDIYVRRGSWLARRKNLLRTGQQIASRQLVKAGDSRVHESSPHHRHFPH